MHVVGFTSACCNDFLIYFFGIDVIICSVSATTTAFLTGRHLRRSALATGPVARYVATNTCIVLLDGILTSRMQYSHFGRNEEEHSKRCWECLSYRFALSVCEHDYTRAKKKKYWFIRISFGIFSVRSVHVGCWQDLQRNTEARSCNCCCGGISINYYIFWACVCSLRYLACNAHAPGCYLWPIRLCLIIPHYLINGMILEKTLLNIKYIFYFLHNFCVKLQVYIYIYINYSQSTTMFLVYIMFIIYNIRATSFGFMPSSGPL